MVHVKIVVSGEVCVQNNFPASLCSGIEQHVQTEGEVVEKEVTSFRLHSTM